MCDQNYGIKVIQSKRLYGNGTITKPLSSHQFVLMLQGFCPQVVTLTVHKIKYCIRNLMKDLLPLVHYHPTQKKSEEKIGNCTERHWAWSNSQTRNGDMGQGSRYNDGKQQ